MQSLCLVVFHTCALKLPIQTSLSMAPKLPVSLSSHEKRPNFRKTSTVLLLDNSFHDNIEKDQRINDKHQRIFSLSLTLSCGLNGPLVWKQEATAESDNWPQSHRSVTQSPKVQKRASQKFKRGLHKS